MRIGQFIGRHLKVLPLVFPAMLCLGIPILNELRVAGVIDRAEAAFAMRVLLGFVSAALIVIMAGFLFCGAVAAYARHHLKTCPCPSCKRWRISEGYEEEQP